MYVKLFWENKVIIVWTPCALNLVNNEPPLIFTICMNIQLICSCKRGSFFIKDTLPFIFFLKRSSSTMHRRQSVDLRFLYFFQDYSIECLQHVQRHLAKNEVPVTLFEVRLIINMLFFFTSHDASLCFFVLKNIFIHRLVKIIGNILSKNIEI